MAILQRATRLVNANAYTIVYFMSITCTSDAIAKKRHTCMHQLRDETVMMSSLADWNRSFLPLPLRQYS